MLLVAGGHARAQATVDSAVVETCRHAYGTAVGPPDYEGERAAGLFEPVAGGAFFYIHAAADSALRIGAIMERSAQPLATLATLATLAKRDGRDIGAGKALSPYR